jgi:Cation transporter/ATPase, N-terminus
MAMLEHRWIVSGTARYEDLLAVLQASAGGLTSQEARLRLRLHGPNSLVEESRWLP